MQYSFSGSLRCDTTVVLASQNNYGSMEHSTAILDDLSFAIMNGLHKNYGVYVGHNVLYSDSYTLVWR